MGLGAAGCGYEYDNPSYKCGHLSGDLFGFKCLKYRVDLPTDRNLNHPIRCYQCCEDASKYWESKNVERKAAETILVRQQNK